MPSVMLARLVCVLCIVSTVISQSLTSVTFQYIPTSILASSKHPCYVDLQLICGMEIPYSLSAEFEARTCLAENRKDLSPQCHEFTTEISPSIVEYCYQDIRKFCRGVEAGDGRVHSCLRSQITLFDAHLPPSPSLPPSSSSSSSSAGGLSSQCALALAKDTSDRDSARDSASASAIANPGENDDNNYDTNSGLQDDDRSIVSFTAVLSTASSPAVTVISDSSLPHLLDIIFAAINNLIIASSTSTSTSASASASTSASAIGVALPYMLFSVSGNPVLASSSAALPIYDQEYDDQQYNDDDDDDDDNNDDDGDDNNDDDDDGHTIDYEVEDDALVTDDHYYYYDYNYGEQYSDDILPGTFSGSDDAPLGDDTPYVDDDFWAVESFLADSQGSAATMATATAAAHISSPSSSSTSNLRGVLGQGR